MARIKVSKNYNVPMFYPHAVMVLFLLLILITHAHGFLAGQKIAMIFRVCTTAAVYQKVCALMHACAVYV